MPDLHPSPVRCGRALTKTMLLGAQLLGCLAALLVASPAGAYQQEVKATAKSIGEKLAKSGKKTVAVVDFTDLQGNATELGRFLAEQVSIALATDAAGLEVVDRTHLKALMQEHRLSATGLIDPQTARKLGQIAGVQALLTGTLTAFGDSVSLSVKALDTATAKILAAHATDVPKTKAVEELLSRGIGSPEPSTRGTSVGSPSSKARASTGKAKPTYEGASYVVTVESARKAGKTMTVEAGVKNATGKEMPSLALSRPSMGDRWKLIDEEGEVWEATRGEQINQLPAGGKKRVSLEYKTEGPGTGTVFSLAGYLSARFLGGAQAPPDEEVTITGITLTPK
jgi:TolB-like protein